MKQLFILLLLLKTAPAFSQNWPVKSLVDNKKAMQVKFKQLPAFTHVTSKNIIGRGKFQQLKLNSAFLNRLMQERPEALELSIPISSTKSITCSLVQFSLGYVKYTENNDGIIDDVKIPLTYRGIVNNEQTKNNVIFTANENYLSLTVTLPDNVLQITQAEDTDKTLYRLYNSKEVQFPETKVDCGMVGNPSPRTANNILIDGSTSAGLRDKCVNVFVDCFDSLYIWNNKNKQKTVDFVYELFNAVSTGYFNDTINIQITTVNVWTTEDHYQATSSDDGLAKLSATWKDDFFGNICVGLDYSIGGPNRGGLAGAIGRIKAVTVNTCPAYDYSGDNTFSACCYNDLNQGGNVRNFPTGPSTTESQVQLVMHEIGHLLGAHHTHWCGWKLSSNPDTFGAIDSCAPTEAVNNSTPACPKGPAPVNGGTIMSYCSIAGPAEFSNFRNGFGKLPGNAIRNFVSQSVCLLNCSDCFGLLYLNKTNAADNIAASRVLHSSRQKKSNPKPDENTAPFTGELLITSQKLQQ